MLRSPLVRAAVLALGLAVLLTPATVSAATTAGVGAITVVADTTPPAPPVIVGNRYDYASSVLYDKAAGLYRMWWCGGLSGDHILYAESRTLAGPFHSRTSLLPNSFDIALAPRRGIQHAFDHTHVCDPSVIKVGRTWYLYYGAANEREPGAPTRIGLATSRDGVTWKRVNDGQPIISPVGDTRTVPNGYGAGQPSIAHVGGWFHLIYTDTTGRGGNPGNGAGQYVLRSHDPRFQTGVEELQSSGFTPYTEHRHTTHSLLEAFGTDWQWSPALRAFVLSESFTSPGGTKAVRIHFFSADLRSTLPGSPVILKATWSEGTGLVGGLDRRLPDPVAGVQQLELVRPLGALDPSTWRLYPVVARTTVSLPTL